MIAYILQEPTDVLLSPLEPCVYVIKAEMPFTNLLKFEVVVMIDNEVKAQLLNLGEKDGNDTIFRFDLQKILRQLVKPTLQPNSVLLTPQIDYLALKTFELIIKVKDLTGANTDVALLSEPKMIWKGKKLRNDNFLLHTHTKIVNRETQNFVSYLYEGQSNRNVRLMSKSYLPNGTTTTQMEFVQNLENPCIITFPLSVGNALQKEFWIEEYIGLALHTQSETYTLKVKDECLENVLFFNECGGWENFTFKSIAQSEGKIESQEISNITLQNLPNPRNKKSVFRELIDTQKALSRSIQDFERETLKDFFQSTEVLLERPEGFIPILITGDTYTLYMKRKLLFLSFTFLFATACERKLDLENFRTPLMTCIKADSSRVTIEYNANGTLPTDTVFVRLRNINTGETTTISRLRGAGTREVLFGNGLNLGTIGSEVLVEMYAKRGNLTSEIIRRRLTLASYTAVPYPSTFTIQSIGVNTGGYWLSVNWNTEATACFALPDDYLSAKIEVWRFGFPNRVYRFNSVDGYPYPMGERGQGSIFRNISLDIGQAPFTIQNGDEIKLLVRTSRNDRTSEASDYVYVNQNSFVVSGL